MKIAFVHDYLIQDGGAERVLLAMHELVPTAPIFTLFYDAASSHADFKKIDIRTSSLNDRLFAKRKYQWYLPLMPQAVEAFDLAGYDVVISNSSSFAKGAIVAPNAIHICYCHTPTRFLWQDRVGYLNDLPQPRFIKSLLPPILHRLRQWDVQAAARPDVMLTNSRTSQERIRRYYRREARILYPPVDVEKIEPSRAEGTYWLAGGRLVAYKRFDLVVRAFAKLNLPLKIYGEGPEERKLRAMAGARTEFVGRVDDQTKNELYRHAIAYLYPQLEDFGITAVEAMAAGKPVVAYGHGGILETVVPGVTGQFFDVQCWEDISDMVMRFEPRSFDSERIRKHAEQFSKARFQQTFRELLTSVTSSKSV